MLPSDRRYEINASKSIALSATADMPSRLLILRRGDCRDSSCSREADSAENSQVLCNLGSTVLRPDDTNPITTLCGSLPA